MIEPLDLCRLLGSARVPLTPEKATQEGLEEHLRERLPVGAFRREVRLSATDIVDFLVEGRIAVEVKVKGASRREIMRQLERYATHARVEALVLVSNVAMSLPREIGGKPAYFVSLGRAWL